MDAQERDLDPADFEDDGQDELLKVSPALKVLTSLGIIAAGYNLTLLVIWVAATFAPLRLPPVINFRLGDGPLRGPGRRLPGGSFGDFARRIRPLPVATRALDTSLEKNAAKQ